MEQGIVKMSMADLQQLGTAFARSGYFADARDAAQAVVKIQAGREMGFGPVYAMTKVYIVKGKVMVGAEALGAMVKRSGRYDYKVKTLTDTECVLDFTDNGQVVYSSRFTIEDAKRADLVRQDSGWTKWPRAMLMSKALSQGARIVCPHVISGVYTPADFGIESDEAGEPVQTVQTIEAEFTEAPQGKPDVEMPKSRSEQLSPPVDTSSGAPATQAQIRKIFASGRAMGYSEESLRQILQTKYKHESTKELTKDEASEFIEAIEAGRTCTAEGQWV